MNKTLPTFLGIGAQKSGTTAVHQFLLSHPQIFLPTKKELRYFSYVDQPANYQGPGDSVIPRIIVRTWEDYVSAFKGAGQCTVRGEISPDYMVLAENAAPAIARRLPGIKLFAILRNPVDRAYSNYQQALRMGREPLDDFRSALENEDKRRKANWSPLFWYKRNGEYHRQLTEYFSRFPRDQIRIYLYEDLQRDPGALMADLYRFLGVVTSHQADFSTRFHPSGVPWSVFLYRVALWIRDRTRFLDRVIPPAIRYPIHSGLRMHLLKPSPRIPEDIRRPLMTYFREDILGLQELIGRDLRYWLAVG